MGNEGKKEKEKKQSKVRDPYWVLWETHLAIETVITMRDKYAQGIGNTEMLREFNRVYLEREMCYCRLYNKSLKK